jgi:hypothetical protein
MKISKATERLILDIAAGYNDPFRVCAEPFGLKSGIKAGLINLTADRKVSLTSAGCDVARSIWSAPANPYKFTCPV